MVLETEASFLIISAVIILKQVSSLYTYKMILKSVWALSDDISEAGAWAMSDLFWAGPGVSPISEK